MHRIVETGIYQFGQNVAKAIQAFRAKRLMNKLKEIAKPSQSLKEIISIQMLKWLFLLICYTYVITCITLIAEKYVHIRHRRSRTNRRNRFLLPN